MLWPGQPLESSSEDHFGPTKRPPANFKYKCRVVGCLMEFKLLMNRTEHVRLAHPEMYNHESSLRDRQDDRLTRHVEIPCENCELSLGFSCKQGSVDGPSHLASASS